MLKITIDTSIIAAEDNSTLGYLVNAHKNGVLDVAVANRFKLDKSNDTDPIRIERQRQVVAGLHLVPSGFIIGVDNLGDKMAVAVDDELHQQLFCLFEIDINARGGMHSRYDVDHIYSHLMRNRDIFLTFEGRFIKKRAVLKDIGIHLAHPEHFIEAMKQAEQSYSIHAPEFQHHLCLLLDQMHKSPMNVQVYKRLQDMREAQAAIKEGRYTKEDEKAIRYIAANFKLYSQKQLETAVKLIKQQYHSMKAVYLSRYPGKPITARNIADGLKEIYGHVLNTETG